jgi:hypothetical protein
MQTKPHVERRQSKSLEDCMLRLMADIPDGVR